MTAAHTTEAPGPRAQTLPIQSIVNRMIRVALRAPLLCRLIGRRLIVVEVIGRKTGRRYDVPVAYTRDDGSLLIGTPFRWGRNLRTGETVTILLKGKRRPAEVTAITDEPGVVAAYGTMARDNRQFAKFNRIALDDRGEPDRGDLHLAWTGGARAFRLVPA